MEKLLGGFWAKFIKTVESVQPLQITEVINRIDEALSYHLFPPREDGSDPRVCPECGKGRLSIKLGKFGAFIGCSNYPECKYTKPLVDTTDEEASATPKLKSGEDKVLGEQNGLKIYLKKAPTATICNWERTLRPRPKTQTRRPAQKSGAGRSNL